jgi:putative ABC transport system permease protein
MAGAADLQVVGPRGGFDEQLYAQLAARPEVAEASPLVEVEARLVGRDESLQVLGVDAFVLARVTPRLLPRADSGDRSRSSPATVCSCPAPRPTRWA